MNKRITIINYKKNELVISYSIEEKKLIKDSLLVCREHHSTTKTFQTIKLNLTN
jgi:hypothetical protein